MKKLLLFLFVCVVGFISFSNAGTYEVSINYGPYRSSVGNSSYPFFSLGVPVSNSSSDITYSCYVSDYQGPSSSDNIRMFYSFMSTYGYISSYSNTSKSISYSEFFYGNGVYSGIINSRYVPNYSYLNYVYLRFDSSSVSVNGTSLTFTLHCTFEGDSIISSSCPSCSPQYTSSECQSEYNLVPSSDLSICQSDLSSCQSSLSGWNNTLNNCSNNLLSCESSLSSCIQSNCPIGTGDVMWSSLWINGIQHLGKSVINVSIPDYIHWDYTTNDESFDLYVGSGYDQNYIDSVLSINSYRPTSEDFSYIFVSGLTLIFPYIFVALLIIFMRKLIKRIFK